MKSLDAAYAELLDPEDGKVDLSNLEGIRASFEELENVDMSAVNKSLEELANADSLEESQQAMDSLVNQYLELSGILETVTDDNKELITEQLRAMGISNAEEVVQERLTVAKYATSTASKVLNNSIVDGISAIQAEAEAAGISVAELSKLELAKLAVNDAKINTSSDIDNVIALANAAGASAKAIANLEQAKRLITSGDSQQQRWAQNIVDQVGAGTYDYDYQAIDSSKFNAKYSGGSASQKQIEANAKAAKDVYDELFNWYEIRLNNLKDAISLVQAELENVTGSFNKNRLIDAEYSLNQQMLNENTAMLAQYSAKAQELLAKIPTSLQAAAQNGAIAVTQMVGDSNKEIVDAVNTYREWADKVSDVSIEIANLKTTLRQLQLEKFTNIAEDFADQFDIVKNTISNIQAQISLVSASGNFVGEGYYSELINQAYKQIDVLNAKKNSLASQLSSALSSGQIQAGTDEWVEMVNVLQQLDAEILSCKTDIEEFNNSIQDLHWEVFDKITEQFDNLSTELQNIMDVIDDDSTVKDGQFTSEGITKLGLYAQQYELASYASRQYAKEIDELQSAYQRGEYTALEYAEKLAELNQAQWDSIDAAEAAKDAIIELNRLRVEDSIDAINDEIDAMSELTQAKKDQLDAEIDLYEYRKSITEKTKSVTDLQRQIAAMAGDDTAETVAKRRKLEAELSEAQADLDDFVYKNSIDKQKEALDEQEDNFTKEKESEIDELEKSLEDTEALLKSSFEIIKNNTSLISAELSKIASDYGVEISTTITDAWAQGSGAISSYSSVLTEQSSIFQQKLLQTQNSIYALATESNRSAIALASMYATSGQNLMNTLLAGRSSLANTTYATNVLQNALQSTLSSGYDTSGITSALNSIRDAANDAASAIRNMLNAQGEKNYKILINGQAVTNSMSKDEAESWLKKNNSSGYYYMAKYAKGGVLTGRSDADAKKIGEDHIATIAYKDGERILTPVQNTMWEKWTASMPDLVGLTEPLSKFISSDNKPVPTVNSSPVLNYVVNNNVAGDVSEKNLKLIQEASKKTVKDAFDRLSYEAYKKGVRSKF